MVSINLIMICIFGENMFIRQVEIKGSYLPLRGVADKTFDSLMT